MSQLAVDVLVVGGGPSGLYAADRLARRGMTTIVCEEHATIGDPVHCTGVLATESFDVLGLPRDASLNTLTPFEVRTGGPLDGVYIWMGYSIRGLGAGGFADLWGERVVLDGV